MAVMPPLSAFAASAYAFLEPIAGPDADHDYALAALCGAVGEMFRDGEDLVRARPGRQPWQQAFDIDEAPDFQLGWLGQLVGVRVTPGVSGDAQRAQVRAEDGFQRGSVASLVAKVQATLTGTRRVRLIERSSDAWTLAVITDPAETPDPTATNRAAQSAKVAGLVLSVSQSSVPLFIEGTRTFAAGTGTFATATLANVT